MSQSRIDKIDIKNFLSISDLKTDDLLRVFELSAKFKRNDINVDFGNKILGLIFDKASTRTRISFQVAISNLGGNTIELNPQTSQIGRGEPIKDTARVLSRYCDVVAIRTFQQIDIEEYAKWSDIPVINALTDLEHPCQVLADFFTIKEEFKNFDNTVITFIGDGNNVANSLILCACILGVEIRIACPEGFEPKKSIIKKALKLNPSNKIKVTNNIAEALNGANVIYTDVWASMGEEGKKEFKEKKFKGFSINSKNLKLASEKSIVLHCLPAYRGKEITDEIIDCPQSRIFNQAENRLHTQQALLALILNQ